MLASDLDFDLPPELIAQVPLEPRDAARLLHVSRSSGALSHRVMRDLPDLVRPSDLLVFNDTRVLRARLHGCRATGGKAEALLLKEHAPNLWECLLKPSARLRSGAELTFSSGTFTVAATAEKRLEASWLVRFAPPQGSDLRDWLPELGEVPLPPYIHVSASEERYQTVYARAAPTRGTSQAPGGAEAREGAEAPPGPLDSAAAPTAGLHFTPELLERLKARGVKFAYITLAVGAGTFRPVQTETLEEHQMHSEEFWIPRATAEAIAAQRAHGHRVIAVGTTSTRALESVARSGGLVSPGEGETAIFIRPGYRFQVVDGLITNFHLPRSTLLALVAAFAENSTVTDLNSSNGENRSLRDGLNLMRAAYAEAVAMGYRFFSFGDAMWIE